MMFAPNDVVAAYVCRFYYDVSVNSYLTESFCANGGEGSHVMQVMVVC